MTAATESFTAQTDVETAIHAAIAHLADPEIPIISLSELGILRGVRTGADGVAQVVITPTYSGCPAMGQIEDDVKAALAEHGLTARVVTQLTPAWTTDWMSEIAREKLRAYGIAPPQCASAGNASHGTVKFSRRATRSESVPCPQCGSSNTTEVSPFGSTACKAQYRCLNCLEPFDYFKPY
jgi:ring-1,2-phenylacetyl-CoA epoxidase subunit PaaD